MVELREHRLLTEARALNDRMGAMADPVAAADPDYLDVDAKRAVLIELHRLEARTAALRLRIMSGSDELGDIAEATGSRDVGAWLADAVHLDPRAAGGDLALARRLAKAPALAAAIRDGATTPAHLRPALQALADLPADLDSSLREQVENTLAGYVRTFTPAEIKRLGRRVLEVVAPEVADAHEERLLADEEARAWETCRLTLTPGGDGTTRLTGVLPDLSAAILTKALDALTNPRRDGDDAADLDDRRTPSQRRGQALCTLIEHLPADALPLHGRAPVTLIVTLDQDWLTGKLGRAGLLDTGGHLSAAQARRLACSHRLLPAVLDGDGAPLDLGRGARLFSAHQVTLKRSTTPHCQARGCTIPSAWTEAHHRTPWSRGGPTDYDQLLLLCSRHHHLAHHHRWRMDDDPGGGVDFHRVHDSAPAPNAA